MEARPGSTLPDVPVPTALRDSRLRIPPEKVAACVASVSAWNRHWAGLTKEERREATRARARRKRQPATAPEAAMASFEELLGEASAGEVVHITASDAAAPPERREAEPVCDCPPGSWLGGHLPWCAARAVSLGQGGGAGGAAAVPG